MSRNRRHGCRASMRMALGLVLLASISGLLLMCLPVRSGFAQAKEGVEIFVTSNGVHTDIVVPVKTQYMDWRQLLPLRQFATADSSYTYVSFGWGDRRFYIETPEWKDLTPQVAISAAFWPTPTAMHVEYIAARLVPNHYQRPLVVSGRQYQRLVAYITGSFQQQSGAFIRIPGAGYSGRDNFYEAKGKFYILKNCNSWVNNGLKAMGAEAAVWAPLPFAVMRHLPEAP